MSPPRFSQMVLMMIIATLSKAAESAVVAGGSTSWCVARSDATTAALQAALDYACASGADCTPLQTTGLCFLPNTIQAHASYAFNSYYQRMAMSPGSCAFSGTSTIAKSDPSYGSCVYPASFSAAGGGATASTSVTPAVSVPLAPGFPTPLSSYNGSSTGFSSAGINPPLPNSDISGACSEFVVSKIFVPVGVFCVVYVLSNV